MRATAGPAANLSTHVFARPTFRSTDLAGTLRVAINRARNPKQPGIRLRASGPFSENDNATEASRQRQDLFNSISTRYDQLNDLLSFGLHRVWKRMTVSWSGAQPGDTALDICCGSGDIAFLLSERVGPSGQVTGLDFSGEQLVVARNREAQNSGFNKCSIEWVLGDALDLPFSANSFDAITMGYGLRNVTNISRALDEVQRVLRPGKRAAILDFNNSKDPAIAGFQSFMLNTVVVPVARSLDLAAQYEYLEPSIKKFPHGDQLEALGVKAGFTKAVYYEVPGGLMGVLVVTK